MALSLVTTDGEDYNSKNYINGNYILDKSGKTEFIACQGPLQNTTEDFWQMVLVNNVESIVGKTDFNYNWETRVFLGTGLTGRNL